MATTRGPRLQVGSASWVAEERASALQIAETEAEEFSFSVRNDVDWLNEHMAEIFSKNQVYVNKLSNAGYTNVWSPEMSQKYSKHQGNYEERLPGQVEKPMPWKRVQ